MRHRYYQTARARQIESREIADGKRLVAEALKSGALSFSDAVSTLRQIGLFEAEISETLSCP